MAARDANSAESTPGMKTQQSIRGILDSAFAKGDVRRVYGEPVVHNGKTVIPIASVGSAFGFGSGSSGEAGKEGEGGGGGGKVSGHPIGYLEISDEGNGLQARLRRHQTCNLGNRRHCVRALDGYPQAVRRRP